MARIVAARTNNARNAQMPKWEGKDNNWLRTPEYNLYNAHLDSLPFDAPKLLTLKKISDQRGEDAMAGQRSLPSLQVHQ